ncbi:MAG: hypothetical protein ACKOX7_09050 [Bacteroidota bacterium]
MNRAIFYVSWGLSVLLAFQARAQVNPNEFQEEPKVLMKNEWTLGVQLHSAGWGVDYRRGKNITASKKKTIEFDLVNIRHPKEIRSVNPYFDNAKPFFYGKLNSVIVIRGGIGRQKILYSKAEKAGVEVRFLYSGGFSLALAKPVYLYILYPTDFRGEYEVVIEKYDPDKHFVDNIYGRAPSTSGFDGIKPYPGAYAKTGLSFEYGSNSSSIKCLEAGVCFDAYAKEIPIMAYSDNSAYYMNVYLNLVFGRRW